MKILSSQQIRDADEYTIVHEPIAPDDLMERAAAAFSQWFTGRFPKGHPVKIFCGTGNNGGDGLAIARMLLDRNHTPDVFITRYFPTPSQGFRINEDRLKKTPVKITDLHDGDAFPAINASDIVVDGLWGSGLNRNIEGFAGELIHHLNNSAAIKVAIDIPSGLFADTRSDSVKFQAHYTFTFELPKLSFFFPENFPYVGDFIIKSIGLHPTFLRAAETPHHYTVPDDVKDMVVTRKKFDHKGSFGHALLVTGSYGKIGAAVLSAEACLRAGTGLVTAHIPKCGYAVIQTRIPEVMVTADKQEEIITDIPDVSGYKAIGAGPGLGVHARTAAALRSLLAAAKVPLVLDADALNILSENKTWLSGLPHGSILTPHPKEFARLFGESRDSYEMLELQKNASRQWNIFIVLKRAHTVVTSPDGNAYFNSTGNPGMATAGSGDVLTGIITGLLCRGYAPLQAAILGVYLHGLAGDYAAQAQSMESMTAGDITHHLGNAFNKILSY